MKLNKNRLKNLAIKFTLIVITVILFVTVWRDLRVAVLDFATVPLIENAQQNCENTIYLQRSKDTSIFIFIYDFGAEEYERFGYNSPGGFYFVAGLLIIILLNGNSLHYKIWAGFHFPFWLLTIPFNWLGSCYSTYFLHFNHYGIRYATPFITFLILALIISPKLKEKLDKKS